MSKKYDVIIIGAGIGGLVCGSYLAKAGKKVLIIERNSKAGGYCTSFNVNNFTFDLGIHAIEACGEKGIIRQVFNELALMEKITVCRIDPSDIILTNDTGRINIWNNVFKTRDELKRKFLKESKQIDNFFDLLINDTPIQYIMKFKKMHLKQLLIGYFTDKKLLNIISILIRNIGIPLEKLSAANGMIFLKQYLKDGGYYPAGDMQAFSEAIVENYMKLNGEILYSTTAETLIARGNKVRGVKTAEKGSLYSDIVISNCDATWTLSEFAESVPSLKGYRERIKKMRTSLPALALFLALRRKVISEDKKSCAIWYSKSGNVNKDLLQIYNGKNPYDSNLVMVSVPSMHDESLAPVDGQGICLLTTASFRENTYWLRSKRKIVDNLLSTALPILGTVKKKDIKHMAIWSPCAYNKITNNRNGAVHGWAPLVNQVDRKLVPEKLPSLNLYLVGHWTTQPGQGGLPMVFASGRSVAKRILAKMKYD